MARLVAVEKILFYPTDLELSRSIAKLIKPLKKGGRLFDPCSGTGKPAAIIAKAIGAESYGTEISFQRAAESAKNLDHVMNSSYSDIHITGESLNVVFNNPPYDQDRSGNGKRLEYEFLRETTDKLGRGGLQIYIVPLKILKTYAVALHLSNNYENWKLYNYPDTKYGQVVLIANRRLANLRFEKLEDCVDYNAVIEAGPQDIAEDAQPIFSAEIPALHRRFSFYERIVSRTIQVNSTVLGGVRSMQEWQDLMHKEDLFGRMRHPLMPLKVGHIAMILASGALGLLELVDVETNKKFIIKGRAVKYTEKVDETIDDNDDVIQEKFLDKWETTICIIRNDKIEVIKDVESLTAFIEKYGQQIGEYISKKFKSRYNFDAAEDVWTSLKGLALKRKVLPGAKSAGLLPAQMHTAAAIAIALKEHGSANIQGEMGTGKSTTSAAASYLMGITPATPGLVICDPTMRLKWVREIQETIPGSVAVELRKIGRVIAGDTDIFGVKYNMKEDADGNTYLLKPDGTKIYNFQANDVEDFFHAAAHGKLGKHPYAIVSHSTMSISSSWHHVGWEKKNIDTKKNRDGVARIRCVACGQEIKIEKEDESVYFTDVEEIPHGLCDNLTPGWQRDDKGRKELDEKGDPIWGLVKCGHPWYATDSENEERRESVAHYIHQYFKDRFKVLIADEAHKFKSQSTDRGVSFYLLRESCRYVIQMTGTFFGGKSTSIFWLLYRTSPHIRDEFHFQDSVRWASQFGVQMTVRTKKPGKPGSYGRTGNARWQPTVTEKPGVGPGIIAHLLHNTVFLTLADLGLELPAYGEEAVIVDPFPKQGGQYAKMDATLFDYAKQTKNFSVWLQWCLARMDSGFRDEQAFGKDPYGVPEMIMDLPRVIEYDETMPKEQWLVKYVLEQKAKGRKTLVYVRLTGERDMLGRLEDVMKRNGIRAISLHASVGTAKRESWIQERAAGVDVLLVNPKLVETGLDLIMFQNVVFFQIEYSLYTLWQAVRRVWRLGQDKPVEAYYMAYKGSMEERALSVMGSKMKAAQMVYGDQVGGAIVQTDEGDMLFQLTRDAVAKAPVADVRALFADKAATTSYSPTGSFNMPSAPIIAHETPKSSAPVAKGSTPMSWDEWVARQKAKQQDEIPVKKPAKAKVQMDRLF